VSRFIALNEFARTKLIQAGLPSDRLVVKPNFVPDPGEPWQGKRSGFVYVGRLSVEKGIRTLVEAWHGVDAPLTIFGDGPELPELQAKAPANVVFAGHQSRDEIQTAVARAAALVLPSICYENFPMVLVEAFAAGTPVLASRRGALQSLVAEGVTGLLFQPGDSRSLAMTVRHALGRSDELVRMGREARAYYLRNLGPDSNLRRLETIYRQAQADPLQN
jgi:glycosyltransferase involved in cell wall biosynthesis